jgi:two-component system OmpR family sensor kinase
VIARWSLRRRLLVTTVGLIALVSLVVGVVSVVALRGFLTDRLDQQLRAAVERTDLPAQPGVGAQQLFEFRPGQGEGTLIAGYARGILGGQVLNSEGERIALTETDLDDLRSLPIDGEPHTRDLGVWGEYRVVAQQPVPGGPVYVTGLPLDDVQNTLYRLTLVIVLVAAAVLVAATLLGAALIDVALRPLRRVASTAVEVSELPLSRGEVDLSVRVPDADTDPATEAGQVGAALNRLLDHVSEALTARQASESRVRRFVADASHELRTPLTSIRGYAELTRRGGSEVPDDVGRALGRIESESIRMSGLVDDLLLLARLDEGRPLERRPVDLTALLVDAVGDAHAAAPHHRWDLDVPDSPVVVTGDRGRLHQVVANLLANARVHTPDGTRVTVSLRAEDDRAVFEVADDGPGIDPALLPEVFERFARGDTSRSRMAGSTGLGLALVQAVVDSHGGRVSVESRPGRTCFRVILPVADQA